MENTLLNLIPAAYLPEIHLSQYDVGRTITFTLKDGASGYSVPSGASVKVKATKPSGFGFEVACTFNGGTVTLVTTDTMTPENGRFPAELSIVSGNTVIGTSNFIFNIERSPHPEGTIDGDAESLLPELTLLVERIEAAASSVLDMQVVADTLPAGSQASYAYDEELNKAMFGIPQGESGAGAVGTVASAYDASKTYAVGDYAIHNNDLYRCITAITTAETFTASHWTKIVLADDVTDLKTDLEYIDGIVENKIEIPPYSTLVGKRVYEENGVWYCWGGTDTTAKIFELVEGKTYILDRASGPIKYGFANTTSGNNTLYNGGESNTPVIFTANGDYKYIYSQDVTAVTPDGACSLNCVESTVKTDISYLKGVIDTETSKSPYKTFEGKRIYQSSGTWYCWGGTNTTAKVFTLEKGKKYILNRANATIKYGFANTDTGNNTLSDGGQSDIPVEIVADGTYKYLYSQDINADNPDGTTSLIEITRNVPSIKDIQANSCVSAYNVLDGWESHAIAFSKMMADVTDTEAFMFFTDSHFMAKTGDAWKEYFYAIFAYMEQLYYATPCSFVLHGGDWLGTGEPRLDYLYKLTSLGGVFRSKFDRFALLVGNHECGNQSEEHEMFTHDTLANTLMPSIGRTYYLFKANTFNMYCFDSWQSGAIDSYAEEQIDWFAKALESETTEHIVIAIHILYDSESLRPFPEQLSLCAKAYNDRTSYTYNGITYDFSSAVGKVAFIIAGHEHADSTGTVNDIPYIMTTNTTGYSDTSFDNLPLPVDLMKVDWTNGMLTAYRVSRGAEGTTRTLNIIN